MDILEKLVSEFKLKREHVKNVIELLDSDNTIPFIARYRKEQTGEMQDVVLRKLADRLSYIRNLESRKEEIIRLIDEQGKLTGELKEEIVKAQVLQRLEDLYRPYKKKRRTRATIAKEKNLEELANLIMEQDTDDKTFGIKAKSFINEELGVMNIDDALSGAMDIIAEIISDNPTYRDIVKEIVLKDGYIMAEGIDKDDNGVYKTYYDYKEPVKNIVNHRILALNRGEKEKKLRVKIYIDEDIALGKLKEKIIINSKYVSTYLESAIDDGYKRLLFPSVEREIRNSITQRAEEDAINVFSMNLEPLLMQPPIKGKTVLAIDPGFRTGCKIAVIDETGKVLDYTTIYPTEPRNKIEESKITMKDLIKKYSVDLISIGNGTASREVEVVVSEILLELNDDISYIIVSEAGASIYSASEVGIKEFPDLDVTIRGAVSIGRRLQDPLAELVKIEPKHIGVGQYQHDLNQIRLDEALKAVVEDSVNKVGVDLNTGSPSLLNYVSGISPKIADNIVLYREENGKFSTRNELLKVKGLGPKTFEQCAGFLRIPRGKNQLENTGVHPESYKVAKELLKMDYKNVEIESIASKLDIGVPTLKDIIIELEKPGRDPRDEMPKPILRKDILKIEDLENDLILKGTVRNVVDFGAFIDLGVKIDGLVHISQLSEKFVKHPKELLKVGDIVTVRIIDIDKDRGRISLSMKNIK